MDFILFKAKNKIFIKILYHETLCGRDRSVYPFWLRLDSICFYSPKLYFFCYLKLKHDDQKDRNG